MGKQDSTGDIGARTCSANARRSHWCGIRRIVLPVLAFVVLEFSAVGLCQTASGTMETGTLIPNARAGGSYTRSTDVRLIMRDFAGCTYRRSPGRVEKMLTFPFGSPQYKGMFESLVTDDCLAIRSLTFSDSLLRGELFEQLYMHDFGKNGPDDFTKVELIDYREGYQTPLSSYVANVVALGQFGDCVARADAKDGKQFLLSVPNSSGEGSAVNGLAPHLSACVPVGQEVHFSRSTLRAALAEGLYRLSRAAQGRAWGANSQNR